MAGLLVVRFWPSGRAVRVTPGTTLLEAARAAGLPLGSSCDGRAVCGWCRVAVLEGIEGLSAADAEERELLGRIEADPAERLACQARVLGPVMITTSYW